MIFWKEVTYLFDKKHNTQQLLLRAIFASLTLIATLFIRLPIPSGQGYINAGDIILMLVGLLMGPSNGFWVGAIGSGLADMLAGYAIYMPFTFIIKGLQGFLAGWLFNKTKRKLLSTLLAGLWMAIGYLLADCLIYGFSLAIVAFPLNLLQGLLGAVAAVVLYRIFLPLFTKRFK